ncbi:zinc finger, CCHC-type containing protein [Tanacetum coccineum]
MAAAMKHMASNFAKLDKFERVDLKRWQKKMHFLFSSMSVVYVLTIPMPEDGGDNPTVEQVRKRAKWDNDNYVCRGLILNVKKFLVSNFTNYKMTDSRRVLEQYNELLGILGRFTQHKMNMDESIQVSCIIDKLPPSWKDFKRTLKHLKEGLTLIELGSHLRIEESLRAQDNNKPKGNNVVGPSVVNMVEHNNSSRYNDNRGKRKHHDTKADPNKKPKVTCWKCGKPGHLKRDCKPSNVGNKANGSGTKGSVDGSSNPLKGQNMFNKSLQIYYVTYVSEAYFVQDDDVACNLCDLRAIPSLGNKKYFVTFIDDDLRFCYVYLLHSKDEALDKFKVIKTEVELQQGSLIKRFKIDRGGPSQGFWGEATLTTCYLLNRVPNKKNMITPYEHWTKKKPNLNYLRVWGCRAVVRLPDPKLKTLGERGIELIFVGYAEHFKAFRFYVIEPNDSIAINSIIDTYAPLTRISTIRLLIAMALIHSLIIHQIDVKTTFLNGELEEEVYMNQPLGFIMPVNENKVCKLIKSLYGLKQAPKQWHQKFDEVVLSNGYLLNQAEKCVYSKFDESGKGVIIFLYVDDMLIFGTNKVQVDLTKEFLSSRFSMKDMGEADVILGIRIKHESNGISISQSHYIEKVLKKFNYSDCTPVSTPMDTCEKLMPNKGQTVSQLEYSKVIGYLMYAVTCTRPDIAFAVGKLSRYTSNPGTQHWQAIQRVLKYLKKTMDYRLMYIGYLSVLEGYIDASWISNTKDNSSTSGWVFLLGGGAISWASKKQTCITGSTMESEFVALAAVSKEAEWLKNLLLEIPLWVKPISPISIRCDSDVTLAKAYSQMYNGKSRHLCVMHNMIHELITNGVISIEFVRSQRNLADHLTKGLARDLVIKSAEGMIKVQLSR